MKLVVLSRSRTIASTRRIVAAAEARGHTVRVLNPLKIVLHLGGKEPRLFYKRKRLTTVPDAVIPRVAASIASYALPIVEYYAGRGAVVLNSARAIGQARNPARTLQWLASSGVPIPSTLVAHDAGDVKAMVELVGGVPVLVKLLQGHERRGMMVCETTQSLEAALEAIFGLGHNIVVQEYVKKAGRDVRVFVVGGKALAAVCRVARAGRLSRTLSRLAQLETCELTDAYREVAEKTAKLCELEVCAVDLLVTRKGPPKVFEINASPALAPMEEATHVDLAAAIVARAEELVTARRQQVSP